MQAWGPESTSRNKQGGAAVLLIVLIFSIIGFLFILGNSAQFSKKFSNEYYDAKRAYAQESAASIEAWYNKNIDIIDDTSVANVLTEDAIFAQTAIPRKYGARIGVSNTLLYTPNAASPVGSYSVGYRSLVLWIPVFGEVDASVFDPATGVFTPSSTATTFVLVDGRKVQGAAIQRTLDTMRQFARALEARFSAKMQADPVHEVSLNYFRPLQDGLDPVNCTIVVSNPEEFPCTHGLTPGLTGFASVRDIDLQTSVGVSSSGLNDAWGKPLLINNNAVVDWGSVPLNTLMNGTVDAPPFRMVIRTQTPWGTDLLVHAVQPLN